MTKNQTGIALYVIASLLLLLPLIAMQLTSEVRWTPSDFLVAAILLYGTATACYFALRQIKSKNTALAVCGAIVLCLVIIWVELAVGIFH